MVGSCLEKLSSKPVFWSKQYFHFTIVVLQLCTVLPQVRGKLFQAVLPLLTPSLMMKLNFWEIILAWENSVIISISQFEFLEQLRAGLEKIFYEFIKTK